MDSNMMNMCNMCMHKAYCPMASGMKPMGMNQIPIDMDMNMGTEMDLDFGTDMDMEQLRNMDLTDDIMDNIRDSYSITEDIDDIDTNVDFIQDDDLDLTRRRKNSCKCDVDRILRKMERNNPGIFRRLTMCGMPYFQAKRFVGRIISLSLDYCRD